MCIRAFQTEVVRASKKKKKLYQAKCILRDFCCFLLMCIRTFQKASVLRDLNIFKSSLNLEPSSMKELKSYRYPLKCSISQLTNVTMDSWQAVSDISAKGRKNKTLSCITIKK